MVQTETSEREQTSKGLSVQIIQGVVAETKPFDILQTLKADEICLLFNVPTTGDIQTL